MKTIRPDEWFSWIHFEENDRHGVLWLRISQDDGQLHLSKTTAAELIERLQEWLEPE